MLGSIVFANDWDVVEKPYEQYFCYVITDAPEKYKNLTGTMVFAWISRSSYRNLYESSCKEGIIEFLKNEDFNIAIDPNYKVEAAFLPVSFMEKYFSQLLNVNISVSKEDLDYIWENLSTKYAGFSDMKKKGFNKKQFYKIKNTSE